MMTKKCFGESREGEKKKKKYLFALEVEPLSSTQEEATNSSFESTSTAAAVYAKAAAADAAALIAPHTFMMRTREKSNYLVPSNTLL